MEKRKDGRIYCRGILVSIKMASIMLDVEYHTLRRAIKKHGTKGAIQMFGGEDPGQFGPTEDEVTIEEMLNFKDGLTTKEVSAVAMHYKLDRNVILKRYRKGDRGERLVRPSQKAYTGRYISTTDKDGRVRLYEGIDIASVAIGRSISALKNSISKKGLCNGYRVNYVEGKK